MKKWDMCQEMKFARLITKYDNMKAVWNNEVIAESNNTIVIEGNHYFPPDAVKKEFLKPSEKQSVCPWKGNASYYTVEVNGKTVAEAAKAGAKVVLSPLRGIAAQMNYGASLATGEILYFVHADVLPPPTFAMDIIKAVTEGNDLGRYYMKFDSNKW